MRQRFFSDLTDAQWEYLRARGFDRGKDPAAVREVADALLYRVRARCPWGLMPPGFPPAEVLREAWAAWRADGTWDKILKAASDHQVPLIRPAESPLQRVRRVLKRKLKPVPLSKLLSAPGRGTLHLGRRMAWVRRAVARHVRLLPGGEALLVPGRGFIQLAQYGLSRFTPHAQLPRWFRQAHDLALKKEYAEAAELYTRLLALEPGHLHALLRRAAVLVELARYEEAITDCRAVLSLPKVTTDVHTAAYMCISHAHTLLGNLDEGVAFGHLSRLFGRHGDETRWDDEQDLAASPDDYEMVAELHNDLAEFVINYQTDFDTAASLYRRGDVVRREYARWLEHAPANTLFLSEDWVRNIGHMALIDFWVKIRRMGWRAWDRVVLLAPTYSTANRDLAEYYRPFMTVLTSNHVHHGLRHLTNTFGPRVASLLKLPDGTTRYFTEGMGIIQQAWEESGGGPLLTLTGRDVAFGRKQLRKMGVPAGAWFVSLHVRSPGYHNEGKQSHQAHRNADIESYVPAIREIVRRGGWVVRMGDKSMQPLPKMHGVVDYALSPHKSPRMDVFLCGGCRFFVGVASGISHVPTTFGVPCVLTNWLSNALPVYSRLDLFVPKLLRTEAGRVFPFDEYLSPDTRVLSYSGAKLAEYELEAVDNTPDELRDVVVEMMDQLDDGGQPSETTDRVEAFSALARKHGLAGFSRISRAFADKHAALLPTPAPLRAVA